MRANTRYMIYRPHNHDTTRVLPILILLVWGHSPFCQPVVSSGVARPKNHRFIDASLASFFLLPRSFFSSPQTMHHVSWLGNRRWCMSAVASSSGGGSGGYPGGGDRGDRNRDSDDKRRDEIDKDEAERAARGRKDRGGKKAKKQKLLRQSVELGSHTPKRFDTPRPIPKVGDFQAGHPIVEVKDTPRGIEVRSEEVISLRDRLQRIRDEAGLGSGSSGSRSRTVVPVPVPKPPPIGPPPGYQQSVAVVDPKSAAVVPVPKGNPKPASKAVTTAKTLPPPRTSASPSDSSKRPLVKARVDSGKVPSPKVGPKTAAIDSGKAPSPKVGPKSSASESGKVPSPKIGPKGSPPKRCWDSKGQRLQEVHHRLQSVIQWL